MREFRLLEPLSSRMGARVVGVRRGGGVAPRVVSLSPEPAARERFMVAVGGGKGGVGKSLITGSLGIALARRGRKVVVVDADLGGANLHTALGVLSPERTMADFIHRRIDRIEDAIVPTGIENLGLISGAHDFLTASNLNYQQKSRLLSRIAAVDADFILLDIGAGLSFNIVDFFLLAHTGLLVVIPEPSSVENAYRFLKMSFFRNLRLAVKQEEVRRYIDEAMDSKNTRGIKSPVELLDAVERLDSEAGRILRDKAARFRPALVVNQLRLPEDGRLGPSITSVCRKHLGLQMDFLGSVGYEDSVWRANRRRQPFLLLFPNSAAAFTIDALAGRLLNRAPPG